MDRAVAQIILEIAPDATPDEVRAAYRRRAFATHPDRAGGDAAAFHAVYDAYQLLSSPAIHAPPNPGAAGEPEPTAQVPPADAAKVLFEYLSDLASEMILNGATPEAVVSFLASEGCPDSVARALERDLRAGVHGGSAPAPGAPSTAHAPVTPVAQPSRRPSASAPRRWPASSLVAAAAAAGATCLAGVWLVVGSARPPAIQGELAQAAAPSGATAPPAAAPPAALVVAPAQPGQPNRSTEAAPATRTAPARSTPPHTRRPETRQGELASVGGTSVAIDAERDALEADQRRFAAVLAELQAERSRIDAAEAELAAASDVERFSSLASRKAAYNARIAVARQTERDLQRRVRELNARIAAWNDRVRASR